MHIVTWRGWTPASDNIWLGVNDEARGAWMSTPNIVPRLNMPGVITSTTYSERLIQCEFGNLDVNRDFEEAWSAGLGLLNPMDRDPGELVIQLTDGTQWACDAVLSHAGSVATEGATDVFAVTWITTEPRWRALSVTTDTNVATPMSITNPTFATNTTGWTKGADPSGITSAFTRDTGVYYDAIGSARINISANSAVVPSDVFVMNDTKFDISAGGVVTIRAAVYSTNGSSGGGGGIYVYPCVRFYDASDALLQTNDGYFPGNLVGIPVDPPDYPDDQWHIAVTIDTPAPANTNYFKFGAKIWATPSKTGSAYFDAFEFISGPFTVTPFDVGGHAPTNLTVTAKPSGNFPQAIYARTFSITNTGTKLWERHPVLVDLGDNSASSTSGLYWVLLRDGKPQRCQISDYDSARAFMWMVVDYLPAGETANYTLLVSDQTVLPGEAWQFNSYTAPAFDSTIFYGTASGGGHSTTVTNTSGLGSEANRWDEGLIIGITGANAGQARRISASTATQLTHAAFGSSFSNGNQYVILMSHNGIIAGEADWTYPVRKTERSDSQRGLWWISSGQKKPSDFRFDVPGGFGHALYLDNDDQFSQKWYTPFDPGGGNDYFAVLDANRTWEGGPNLKDEGGFDGVSLRSPWKLKTLRLDYQLKNPNGMAQFIVGSRQEGGAMEYTHEYADSSVNSTLTNKSEQNITYTADTYETYLGLIPKTGDEIGELWSGDNGQATSATSTTLVDGSKAGIWTDDMFNGGWIFIQSGLGAGQKVAITDTTGSSGTITVASWTTQPDSTSRYIITAKQDVATVRNHTTFRLTLDTSTLTISSVSAETPAYVLYRDIVLSQETAPTVFTEVGRVAIHPETTGRYIVLLADQALVVDGVTQRAWVKNTVSGSEVSTVPPMAYAVYETETDGTHRLTDQWLWVKPGDYTLNMATDESGIGCTIDVAHRPAIYG